ncbi:hypothetical protein SAMN05216298_0487 [Glycomyces sambucus]|uniref:Activator of Hsp90 ATPase homolog 1-like protein n=1 Tax=Glycomyces sambucus TaxID=380244 RepID=A0A1G9CT09_9ACTN|nr:hypothetical protein [Glycomyces sambucus]SDK54544.1 hypothetical protein SAMN05216298_0487 [Glycomyces sambucus]
MHDDPTPQIQVTVAAPADEVWRALRDRTRVRQWHGWDAPELDAEIDSIYFGDIEEDAEKRTLTANGGDRFAVEADGDGARVVLTRAPLSGDPAWDVYYDEITEGWTTFLHQLRFAVERASGARRRTLLFTGHDRADVLDRLGLKAVAELAPGSRYTASAEGRDLAGEVWFRSAHQLGVTVDAWGEGLLVVTGLPGPGTAGTPMLLLSTFDLSEEAFADLDRQWSEDGAGAAE